jgi:hypothetical protein
VHSQCSCIVTLRHVRASGLGHDQRKGNKLELKILAPRILVSARCAPASWADTWTLLPSVNLIQTARPCPRWMADTLTCSSGLAAAAVAEPGIYEGSGSTVKSKSD